MEAVRAGMKQRGASVKARSPMKRMVTLTQHRLKSDSMEGKRHIWEVGLSSWIIQDGNYGDFETGQSADFALEFYSQSFDGTHIKTKSARSLGAAKFDVTAEVIYLTPKVWVLDFGIRAFHDSMPPPGMTVG